jgi:hypothetical protein
VTRRRPDAQTAVDAWNAAHSIGAKVSVRKDDGKIINGETRSEAWVMGGHSAVILITGISGCYLLDRVTAMTDLVALLERDLAEAERKAWDALARWKFWMFGYHAADVIKIKRRLGRGREPFFKPLVELARKVMAERYGVVIGGGS